MTIEGGVIRGKGIQLDLETGKFSRKLQPGDEHDTTPPKSLFTDEQIAPGSDD